MKRNERKNEEMKGKMKKEKEQKKQEARAMRKQEQGAEFDHLLVANSCAPYLWHPVNNQLRQLRVLSGSEEAAGAQQPSAGADLLGGAM